MKKDENNINDPKVIEDFNPKEQEQYNKKLKELNDKILTLNESKERYDKEFENLKKAREYIMEISKKNEFKQEELNLREKKLIAKEHSLEKSKIDLEQQQLEFDRERKKFEKEKARYQKTISNNKNERESSEKKENFDESRGKIAQIEYVFDKLLKKGSFKGCFLIDDKGMLIASKSKEKSDDIAIGAMFSLIWTSLSRTIKNLNLEELSYFKIVAGDIVYLIKDILLQNYSRTLILIVYYDKNSVLYNEEQKISKKMIKNIIKGFKKEIYLLRKVNSISISIENLISKLENMKKLFQINEFDAETKRISAITDAIFSLRKIFSEK